MDQVQLQVELYLSLVVIALELFQGTFEAYIRIWDKNALQDFNPFEFQWKKLAGKIPEQTIISLNFLCCTWA